MQTLSSFYQLPQPNAPPLLAPPTFRPKANFLPQTHGKDTLPINSSINTYHTHKPTKISKNQNLPYPPYPPPHTHTHKKAKTQNFFLNSENLLYLSRPSNTILYIIFLHFVLKRKSNSFAPQTLLSPSSSTLLYLDAVLAVTRHFVFLNQCS